jgi:plasmid maintenance system antidote protein VapI
MHRIDTLSARMQYIVCETRLCQRAFAQELGLCENYISMILNGKRKRISKNLAVSIQALFGYRSEWILTGEGEPKSLDALAERKQVIRELEDNIQLMNNVELESLAYTADKIVGARMTRGK